MKITNCPHKDRKYHAKGKCRYCYIKPYMKKFHETVKGRISIGYRVKHCCFICPRCGKVTRSLQNKLKVCVFCGYRPSSSNTYGNFEKTKLDSIQITEHNGVVNE